MAPAALRPQLHPEGCGSVDLPAGYPVFLELFATQLGLGQVAPLEGTERQSEMPVNIQGGEGDRVLRAYLQRPVEISRCFRRVAAAQSRMTQLHPGQRLTHRG